MRIAYNIALIVSILYLPWWVGALIALVAVFRVRQFFEVMFYGILFDSLYATHTGIYAGIYGFTYVATLYGVIIYSLSLGLRKRLAW